jgi:hypothetical protein
MAADYIKITRTDNARATKHVRLINLIREVQQLVKEDKAIIDHSSADPDFSGLEGANGIGVAAGQGANYAALFAAMRTRVNHADVDAFIDRVGE